MSNEPTNTLLAPRHWGSWFGLFLLKLFIRLPLPWIVFIGQRLGALSFKLLNSRRRIAQKNIALCFPTLSSVEQETLVRESFLTLGMGILSSGVAWWSSRCRLEKLIGTIEGLEHIEQAKKRGKGIIFLAPHVVCGELGARLLSLKTDLPLNVLHREQSNEVFEQELQYARHRYFKKVILRANVRAMVRALKNNEGIFYLPDQNFEREHSVFVPFMGVNTLTITATSRFASMNDSAVIPVVAYFRKNSLVIDLVISPPIENFPSSDDVADTARINEIFEKMIRKHPEQYMWIHRRFKIRPEGEASVY
jgi:KDO2-lipid IV(A) lauroyltransferase